MKFNAHKAGTDPISLYCLCFVLFVYTGFGAVSADEQWDNDNYRIERGDLLRITVFERPDLSGEFRVNLTGQISLPIIGRVKAQLKDPESLEAEIIRRLVKTVHLDDPRVAVDILEYRPIFVVGEVTAPGSYPYVLGSTILHALATGGGRYRAIRDPDRAMRHQVELNRVREELESQIISYWALTIRRARFLAESQGRDLITLPEQLESFADQSSLTDLIKAENDLFRVRRDSLAERIANYKEQITGLENEITSLIEQRKAVDETLRLTNIELTDARSYRKKGLIRKERIHELERSASERNVDRLAVNVAIVRARQDIKEVGLRILDSLNDNKILAAESLQEAEKEIALLQRRIEATANEVRTLRSFGPTTADVNNPEVNLRYIILRTTAAGDLQTIDANEMTRILPGDVVKVLRLDIPNNDLIPTEELLPDFLKSEASSTFVE